MHVSYYDHSILVPAPTMTSVDACTMIIVHVSCPVALMFGEMKGGGSGERSPGKAGGVVGALGPPM